MVIYHSSQLLLYEALLGPTLEPLIKGVAIVQHTELAIRHPGSTHECVLL
jgi:hypothetical protein